MNLLFCPITVNYNPIEFERKIFLIRKSIEVAEWVRSNVECTCIEWTTTYSTSSRVTFDVPVANVRCIRTDFLLQDLISPKSVERITQNQLMLKDIDPPKNRAFTVEGIFRNNFD